MKNFNIVSIVHTPGLFEDGDMMVLLTYLYKNSRTIRASKRNGYISCKGRLNHTLIRNFISNLGLDKLGAVLIVEDVEVNKSNIDKYLKQLGDKVAEKYRIKKREDRIVR